MTLAQFRLTYPTFAAKANEAVEAALAEAAMFVGPEAWEERTDLGLGIYAAHRLIWDAVCSGDPLDAVDELAITSRTVGRTSYAIATELAKLQFSESFYCTKYGRRYIELRRLAGAGAVVGWG